MGDAQKDDDMGEGCTCNQPQKNIGDVRLIALPGSIIGDDELLVQGRA